MECDPTRPTYVHCDGMWEMFRMPCAKLKSHIAYPADPEVCIEWRKACKLAVALVDKVVPHAKHGAYGNYSVRVYVHFHWHSRRQYHYATYEWSLWEPPVQYKACLYLFASAFKWGPWQAYHPDPIQTFPKFRGINMRSDGTPNVTRFLTEWHWRAPQDPEWYTQPEWDTIGDWEKTVWYYDMDYKRCIAMYDFYEQHVTETDTGRSGIVVEIGIPDREFEIWNPEAKTPKTAINKKQWMRSIPLIYHVKQADGSKFYTTRKQITVSPPIVPWPR